MAGKTRPMSQIKQLLRLHKEGCGRKEIARHLGISKNTVKAYLRKLSSLKCGLDDLLELEDPVLEAKFHAGNPAYKDNDRYDVLKSKLDYYAKELKRTGVTKKLLWEESRSEAPNHYGYTQFCYHLGQQLVARKPGMVLIHNPGEKLYVDFAGEKMEYVDQETGELIKCPVFVACLPYSDYCFVMAVKSQSIEEFLYALRKCLEFLGGSPQILVPDNLKAAIVKANRYEPTITRALEDFCNHYKTMVVPARVRKPKDKALVENQVKLIYTRVYARLRNEKFFSLHDLNLRIMEKVICHNQTRMQQKDYCREEKFLSEEKHLLTALPEESYEIKYYREYQVGTNNHIYLTQDKHYYSIPYQWIGQKAKVIYTRSIVRIFVKGERVAVHQRDYAPGRYTTVMEHLCSYHQHYLSRSPEYYRQKAKEKSEELLAIVDLLFRSGRPPEQNYRSCDGLFSLHKKTEPDIFKKACQIAIDCGHCSYRYVLNTIENLIKNPGIEPVEIRKPLPVHSNIRGKEYYKQSTINFNHYETNRISTGPLTAQWHGQELENSSGNPQGK